MEGELHKNHPAVKRVYLYIFLITAFLLFMFVVLYQAMNQGLFQLPGLQQEPSPEPTSARQVEERGAFRLSLRNNDTNEVQQGQTFYLTVAADSEDSAIVGFDALLYYDKEAFTMGEATTPLQSFQLFTNESDDYVSFTAALSPDATASAFTDTEILSIPFTARQSGKSTFRLLKSAATETTKMVEDATTVVFSPAVSALQVTVY